MSKEVKTAPKSVIWRMGELAECPYCGDLAHTDDYDCLGAGDYEGFCPACGSLVNFDPPEVKP